MMECYIMKKIFVATLTLLLLTTFSNHTYAANVPTRPFQEEIIYDIVIDRFNNARQLPSEQVDVNDPFTYNGGDLAGITQMLDDIQQYGFTAISLSPVMENAPKGYHGYWIVDFYKVEEEFGTMEATSFPETLLYRSPEPLRSLAWMPFCTKIGLSIVTLPAHLRPRGFPVLRPSNKG